MMKQIKAFVESNHLYIILVASVLTLLYGNYARTVFSQDSYIAFFSTPQDGANWNMTLGRFVQSGLWYFINEARHQKITFFIFVVLFLLSFLALYVVLIIDIKKTAYKAVLFSGLLFLFANPFYCDWFQYPTKLGMAFGVFFSVLASCLYDRILVDGNKRRTLRYVSIILLLFLASGGYQVTLNYFVIGNALLIGKEYFADKQNQTIWFILKNCIITTILFVLAGILNYLFMRYILPAIGVQANRIGSVDVIGNIKTMIYGIKGLILTNQGMMPRYVYLVISLILTAVFGLIAALKKEWKGILLLVISALMVFVAPFGAWIFTEVWMAPRTLTTFMGIPGMILIDILLLCNSSNDLIIKLRAKIVRTSLIGAAISSVLLLSVYGYQTIKISGDLLVVNALDQHIAGMYYDQIEDYENQTGNTITTIAFPDQGGTYFTYQVVVQTYDTNISSFGPDWSRSTLMDYATQRHFNYRSMDRETYQLYFNSKTFDSAVPDQVVCAGDTAYIAVCAPRGLN